MNRVVSFYDSATGSFSGLTFSGPAEDVDRNLPPGHAALDGEHDHLSRRVDLKTGAVVDYQPPQPTIDHVWNAEQRRWIMRPDLQAALDQAAAAQVSIDAQEALSLRSVRELLLSPALVALYRPADQPALSKLQAIDTSIAGDRAVVSGAPVLSDQPLDQLGNKANGSV